MAKRETERRRVMMMRKMDTVWQHWERTKAPLKCLLRVRRYPRLRTEEICPKGIKVDPNKPLYQGDDDGFVRDNNCETIWRRLWRADKRTRKEANATETRETKRRAKHRHTLTERERERERERDPTSRYPKDPINRHPNFPTNRYPTQ